MVIIRLPRPPEKVGSIIVPDQSRDIAQHNVMAGRIVAMGPLAFNFKDARQEDASEFMNRQNVQLVDWVLIRPFAGTMVQGGQLIPTGWRYVSSFQDVIGIIPADKMPAAETLQWDADESQQGVEGAAVELANKSPIAPVPDNVRERVTYPSKNPKKQRNHR